MIIEVFPPMVVGTLKPSITFGSLPLLQLAPARSPCSQLALLTPSLFPLLPSLLQGSRDALEARKISWERGEQAEQAEGFLRLQEGSRDLRDALEAREARGASLE